MTPDLIGFSLAELIAIATIFIWTGFVRTGMGFGGAALGLPLLLLVRDNPLFFLPMIGLHLLFFSSLNSASRIAHIDRDFLAWSLKIMVIPVLIGVAGLIKLPNQWMVIFVFVVSGYYAITWILKLEMHSHSPVADQALLIFGGYTAGASLIGAPFIIVVATRRVAPERLRDTLFVIWFILVVIKLVTLIMVGVPMQWSWALWLLLPAFGGHLLGLRLHDRLLSGDTATIRRWIGFGLLAVSVVGLTLSFR